METDTIQCAVCNDEIMTQVQKNTEEENEGEGEDLLWARHFSLHAA